MKTELFSKVGETIGDDGKKLIIVDFESIGKLRHAEKTIGSQNFYAHDSRDGTWMKNFIRFNPISIFAVTVEDFKKLTGSKSPVQWNKGRAPTKEDADANGHVAIYSPNFLCDWTVSLWDGSALLSGTPWAPVSEVKAVHDDENPAQSPFHQ